MVAWRSHLYKKHGNHADPTVLAHAVRIGEAIVSVNRRLIPVFTLNHLAYMAGVDYGLLRAIVSRRFMDPYKCFVIHKRGAKPRRDRVICVPTPGLMTVQRWIAQNILAPVQPHPASVAYSKGNKLIDAARPHCGCRWLLKLDIKNFFESLNEINAYRVFRSLHYQPLVSLELARLCTRVPRFSRRRGARWTYRWKEDVVITDYQKSDIGHLPQGAPTSPMLANLVMRELDAKISKLAREVGLTYTRYADDIALSTVDSAFNRARAGVVIANVYKIIAEFGLSPNRTKTAIAPPGARKVVLGLLVDGEEPRLTRQFKARLRQHLYYLRRHDIGPERHAAARGFTSVLGMRNHIGGLLTFVNQIEPTRAAQFQVDFDSVCWPL